MARSDKGLLKIKEALVECPDCFEPWFDLEEPEKCEPPEKDLSLMKKFCFVHAFQPDRCCNAVNHFVCQVMGKRYSEPLEYDMKLFFDQSTPSNPIVFLLSPGSNPEADIQQLREKLGFTCLARLHSVSLGQGQGQVAMNLMQLGSSRVTGF